MKLSPHEIVWLCLHVGKWTQEQSIIGTSIVLAESGGDTDIIARSTTGSNLGQRDHGLWQISGRWHGDKLQLNSDWRNPITNTKLARLIYDESNGWKPWHVYTSGSFNTFLPDATIAAATPWPPDISGIKEVN